MCGIAGFVTPTAVGESGDREDLLARMIASLIPRGPDEEGRFLDPHAALGVRRLAVIDPAGGKQPMPNEDGSVQVASNGEIYNFRDLGEELAGKGHAIRSRSDTEVIAHLYEEEGVACVSLLSGMFALAVWDARRRRLLLARDRLGQKPLYYALFPDGKGDALVFGSEPKALLLHPKISANLDPAALDLYLTYGYIPAPFSIYRAVRKLPPGHQLLWENGNISINRYWEIPVPTSSVPPAEAAEVVRRLLRDAVRSHLVSDVPLGAFLSGGTDSAVVAALMAAESASPSRVFTVSFPHTPQDEVRLARVTAAGLGIPHEIIPLPDLDHSLVEKVFDALDEPCADPSFLPTFLLCRETRKQVTVALSGDGGDELFAGYDWLRHTLLTAAYQARLPLPIRRAVAALFPGPPLDLDRGAGLYGQLRRFAASGVRPAADAYFRRTSAFTPGMKNALYRPGFREILLRRRAELPPPLRDPARDAFERHPRLDLGSKMLYTDTACYLPDDCLTKVDRMSMANSLEVRAPFLDHRLVEYVARLPFAAKFHPLRKKPLLARATRTLLPGNPFARPKRGFTPPLRRWLAGPLGPLARDLLLVADSFLAGWGDLEMVKTMWDEERSGRSDWSSQLWTLLALELWHRRWGGGRSA